MNPNLSTPETLHEHVGNCNACLFAIAKQKDPLSLSGCDELRSRWSLKDHSPQENSPLSSLHFTEEMMENFHFRRLTRLEKKVFEAHLISCDSCAAALHNELLFIYAMQAALQSDPHLFRNRSGAQFQAAAA